MAIIKEKVLDNGVSGNYWVVETSNDKQNEQTSVLMNLYVSKEVRELNKKPIYRQKLSNIVGTYLSGSTVYSIVKQSRIVDGIELNWFADATDDI